MMGDEINKDEHTAAELGNLGVAYYKLGSLYSYLNMNDLLEEYDDVLIKKILELEPIMLNRSQNKYQVFIVTVKYPICIIILGCVESTKYGK